MKRTYYEKISILMISISLISFGCGGIKDTVKAEPFKYIQEEKKVDVRPGINSEVRRNGSLWKENEGLFTDRRAKRVNDIITVKIVESSKATRKASTSTGRSTEMEGGVDALFGYENAFNDSRFNPQAMVGLKGDKSFDGSGSTERSGALTGVITAIVKEVYPNGMMRIEGRRVVTVNEEDQYITLSGLIRRDDIAANNIILSTKIAEAIIEYSGEGIIAMEQKPGWLSSVVDVIWPF